MARGMSRSTFRAALLVASAGACGSATSDATPQPQPQPPSQQQQQGLSRLNHIVVIVLENWSFDSLYGEFDGAEGVTSPAARVAQVDPSTGAPYATLPEVEPYLPATLPNAPFALDPYLGLEGHTKTDPTQKFYQEQQEIHGGAMDLFVATSNAKGLTMGFFHTADLPIAAVARKYTVCDHFFHSAFGGSFVNQQWLVAAATPSFPNAPASMRAVLDAMRGDPERASLRS